MTTYITVRRKALENNKKFNRRRPVFDLRKQPHEKPIRAHAGRARLPGGVMAAKPGTEPPQETIFHGYVRLVYDPEHPINGNGAVAWIEITETEPLSASHAEREPEHS